MAIVRWQSFTRLVGDTALLTLGRYGQYIVTLITIPVVARALGVDGLGLLAVGLSAYFVGSIIVDSGLSQLLLVKAVTEPVETIRKSYLTLRLTVLCILIGVGVVLSATGETGQAVGLGAAAGGTSSLSEEWILLARRRFGTAAAIQVASRVAYLIALIFTIRVTPEVDTVLFCLWGSAAISVIATWALVASIETDLASAGESIAPFALWRSGLTIFGSRLLFGSYSQAAPIVYSSALNATQLGLFSPGDRLLRALQSLFDALAIALLPRLSRTAGGSAWWAQVRRLTIVVLAASLTASALLCIAADPLIRLVFGSQFDAAVPYFQVQTLMLPGAALATTLTNGVLYALGDTRGISLAAVAGTSGAAAGLLLAATSGSLWGAVAGMVASEWLVALTCAVRCGLQSQNMTDE